MFFLDGSISKIHQPMNQNLNAVLCVLRPKIPFLTITFDKAPAKPNKEIYVFQDEHIPDTLPSGQPVSSMMQGPRERQQGAPIPFLCSPGIPVFMIKQSCCGSRGGSAINTFTLDHLTHTFFLIWSMLLPLPLAHLGDVTKLGALPGSYKLSQYQIHFWSTCKKLNKKINKKNWQVSPTRLPGSTQNK